jgi:hypothetical protein
MKNTITHKAAEIIGAHVKAATSHLPENQKTSFDKNMIKQHALATLDVIESHGGSGHGSLNNLRSLIKMAEISTSDDLEETFTKECLREKVEPTQQTKLHENLLKDADALVLACKKAGIDVTIGIKNPTEKKFILTGACTDGFALDVAEKLIYNAKPNLKNSPLSLLLNLS